MAKARRLVVLGAGPVGLTAAIRACALGHEVEIRTDRLPSSHCVTRVECVPAQLVALLVEFGVHPKRIGVDQLFTQRKVQWSGADVVVAEGPPVAYLERPALESALLDIALRSGAAITIRRAGLEDCEDSDISVIDATGRAAVSAQERSRPPKPLVARLLSLPARPNCTFGALGIAAGPDGYAYRLSSANETTVGVVGRGEWVSGPLSDILSRISKFSSWLVEDLDKEALQPGACGPASAQWTYGGPPSVKRIGDAHLARDALASQGLAIGISEALHAVASLSGLRSRAPYPGDGPSMHCRNVSGLVRSSSFAAAHGWRDYLSYLSDCYVSNEQPPTVGMDGMLGS